MMFQEMPKKKLCFNTSQIYKLHGFISNLCEIYYFIGAYCLNTNVMDYLNMKVMCMIFMYKQHAWHSSLNNAHNINVQTIQVNESHSCLFHTNLWKVKFAWLLLPNRDPWSLQCTWGTKLGKVMYSHLIQHGHCCQISTW